MYRTDLSMGFLDFPLPIGVQKGANVHSGDIAPPLSKTPCTCITPDAFSPQQEGKVSTANPPKKQPNSSTK